MSALIMEDKAYLFIVSRIDNKIFRLATLLGGVNTQIFKVNLKNQFYFFLVLLFSNYVGESDCEIKAGCQS